MYAPIILTVDRKGTTAFTNPAFDRFLEQVFRAESMFSRVILTSQERSPSLYQGRHEGRSPLEAPDQLHDPIAKAKVLLGWADVYFRLDQFEIGIPQAQTATVINQSCRQPS